MPKVTDSYYTSLALKQEVDRAAKALDRSRSWVIRKAITVGLREMQPAIMKAEAENAKDA